MTATYTKERELPAARSTLEPVNVQVLLHHRDGVESAPPPRARRAEKPESYYADTSNKEFSCNQKSAHTAWGVL